MNPELTHLMARARVADMYRVAARAAGSGRTSGRLAEGPSEHTQVTLRLARAEDHLTLIRLAQLDSAEPLTLPVILAESCGKPIAAASLQDRRVVADPFEPTAGAVELLLVRVRQIQTACPTAKSPRLARLRALLATR